MESGGQDQLSARQLRVLHALCREYVLTGRPVSSLALSRRHRLEWSSATIRAELVELELRGYLNQPHAASGRYPTARGLSAYLDTVSVATAQASHRRAVDLTLGGAAEGSSMRGTARVLAGLLGCVGIGFVGRSHIGVLERVQLVDLGGPDALVVLRMRDGSRSVRRVRLASPGLHVEVGGIEKRLRALVEGRTLEEAREGLLQLVTEQEATVDALLGEAVRLGLSVCGAVCFDPLTMQVVGQGTLAAAPRVSDDLPRVLELLEDYHRLADVLCQLLPEEGGRARVHLAVPFTGELEPGHAGLSLVGCRLAVAGSSEAGVQTGVVAVLGPDSMDYEAVIPLVEYAAKAIGDRA